MRLAVVGKGGAGKSVVAGTMARVLARGGERVLALDSDLLPGLSLSLGLGPDPAAPLDEAVEKDENGRWRLKPGIGAGRAVQRYAREGPDGIRLLQAGKTPREGIEPILGSLNAYFRVIHRLGEVKSLEGWTMLGDLPAGPRHIAFNWAPYARTFVVVVQPSSQSALTGRRVARIARMGDDNQVVFVANRVTGRADVTHVERLIGERVVAALPADDDVAEAERLGRAPIDHAPDSPVVAEVERLTKALADL
jgi:CO dehydrogenase maturation factor